VVAGASGASGASVGMGLGSGITSLVAGRPSEGVGGGVEIAGDVEAEGAVVGTFATRAHCKTIEPPTAIAAAATSDL